MPLSDADIWGGTSAPPAGASGVMSDDDIWGKKQPDIMSDVGKSAASGMAGNLSYLANPMQLVKNIASPVVSGATRLAGAAYEGMGGELSPEAAKYLTNPLDSDVDKGLQAATDSLIKIGTGADPNYQPQTGAGSATKMATQALPYVMGGEEGAIPGLVRAAGVGAGSEAGKEGAQELGFGEKGQQVGQVLGGAAGAMTPEAVKAVTPAGLPNYSGNILENNSSGRPPADVRASAYVAKTLLAGGEDPSTIMGLLEQGKKTGQTVGESTSNPELLAQQQRIAGMNNPGGTQLRTLAADRVNPDNTTGIVGKLQGVAEPMQARMDEASDNIGDIVKGAPTTPLDTSGISRMILRDQATTNAGAFPVMRTLDRIQTALDSAQDQGNSFAALHKAKQAIWGIRNEASDPTAVDKLDTATANKYYGAINDMLQRRTGTLPPELQKTASDYAVQNRIYAQNRAGKMIGDALDEAQEGGNEATGLGKIYRNLWGDPDKQAELLQGMPPAQQRGVSELMDALNNMHQGGLKSKVTGTIDTGFKLPYSKYSAAHKLVDWISDKVTGHDPNAIADVLTNPDLEDLGNRIGYKPYSPSEKASIVDNFLRKNPLQLTAESRQALPPPKGGTSSYTPPPMPPAPAAPRLGHLTGNESSEAWANAPSSEWTTSQGEPGFLNPYTRPMTMAEKTAADVSRTEAANKGLTPDVAGATNVRNNPFNKPSGQKLLGSDTEGTKAWQQGQTSEMQTTPTAETRPINQAEGANIGAERTRAGALGLTPDIRQTIADRSNPKTELGQISKNNEDATAWDKGARNIIDQGGTWKQVADKLGERPAYVNPFQGEGPARGSLNAAISANTDSIPLFKKLGAAARNGDVDAHRLMNSIAEDMINRLTSGMPDVSVSSASGTGLYGGYTEPSLGVRMEFNESNRPQALAVLTKMAKNFNQEQFHVRTPTKDAPGTTYDDGSYATRSYNIGLKQALSKDQINDVLAKSGLQGVTFGDKNVEMYYVGDPKNVRELAQFQDAAEKAVNAIGENGSGVNRETHRLWVYGNGEGAIPYGNVQGSLRTAQTGASKTAQRVAEYHAGHSVQPNEQASNLTADQRGLQQRIAAAYDKLPDNDMKNPNVRRAYSGLAREVKEQFSNLPIKTEAWTGKGEPYKTSEEMRRDVQDNNHLYYYATDKNSFGPPGEDFSGHPLLKNSGLKDGNGRPMLNNDLFRVVHDYYAHNLSPAEFGPLGEEAAWKNHMASTKDPWARWALTTETRGQNSWVNFNKSVDPESPLRDRPFARQKAALLPPEYALTGNAKVDAPMMALIKALKWR